MSHVALGSNVINGPGHYKTEPWPCDDPPNGQFGAADRIADTAASPRGPRRVGLPLAAQGEAGVGRGRFEREVAPIETPVLGDDGQPTGETQLISRDQGLRDTTMEAPKLKPVIEGYKHTAGTSSQISDGAAAVLWMDEDVAKSLGLKPRARLLHQLVTGTDPYYLLDGPVDATTKMLDRSGMAMSDFDVFEINEAFAAVVLSWAQVHKPDLDRVNINGGAIALGHPVGSTGAALDHDGAARARAHRQGARVRHDVLRRLDRHRQHPPAHLAPFVERATPRRVARRGVAWRRRTRR